MTSCRISLWHVSLVRYFLMLCILMMFSVAALCLVCMRSLKVTLESRCPPKYQTFVDLLIDSPMIFIVMWVALLSCCLLPKINEFSLCFIQFEFNSFQPGLDVIHGVFHDSNGVILWWCFIDFVGVGCLWCKGSSY